MHSGIVLKTTVTDETRRVEGPIPTTQQATEKAHLTPAPYDQDIPRILERPPVPILFLLKKDWILHPLPSLETNMRQWNGKLRQRVATVAALTPTTQHLRLEYA